MSKAGQEEQPIQNITLPIEWHVPDTLQGRYATNTIVQAGQNEFVIFFFETQVPPFVGTPEENYAYLEKKGFIRAECVGKIIVAADLLPKIIEAMQMSLDQYHAAKASSERDVQ